MRKFYSVLTLVLLSVSLYAQSPQKMSYQAVIRNTNDQLVSNKSVGMRISILQGSVSGAEVYKEIYNPNPQTNANGLVTVEIGSGIVLVGTFASIDWSAGPYFIKTETDPTGGTSYTVTGTSELLSVPYALYAKTAENGFSGSYNDLTNQPTLFDGQYSSLTGTPILANVATSGSYNDLSNQPAIFDGAYNSLTGKPILFDGNYNSLTNKPSLFDGAYSTLTGIPTFATVATTGSYNSLSNKPSLFSGAFVDLSGKPTTLSGYGITNAMSTSHAANGITTGDITSWNNKLSSYTETDPVFVLWNKSSGIHITASQVSDFATSVTNNPAMVANSAKISYPTADAAKLAAISGSNTGDETSTSIKTKLGITTLSGSNTGDNAVNSLYSGLITNANHTGDVTGSSYLTIANKVTMTGTSPVLITGSPTVIASSPVAISILPATISQVGSMSAADKSKLNGIAPDAEVNVNADWNATSGDALILNKPSTIAGFGITDAMATTHPANGISLANITNWNTSYSWGNHAFAGYQPLIVAGTVSQYWRGDKTWQILNKTAVGLSNVENQALSTWAGSSTINTLGTITTGVWNAGAITSSGAVIANSIEKSGGTASQFLKADGSVDTNTYLTAIREVADEFIATAAQTIFTLTQIPSINSKVKMYINGVRISNTAYNKTGSALTYIPGNNGSYVLETGDRVQFDYYY